MPDPYHHIAPVYDRVTQKALHGIRERMVALCVNQGVQRVLDVGCGTGRLVGMLHGAGVLAMGVDASFAMLRAGRGKANTAMGGSGALPVVQGQAACLPFQPQAFDMAVYSLVLHETGADPVALLRHGLCLARRVMVLEWHAPQRNLDYIYCLWPHMVERLAGKTHYKHFRAFIRQGGVFGLAHRAGARVAFTQRLAGGSMILALLEQ